MTFYTNVYASSKHILERKIVNGVDTFRKTTFEPSLFVPSTKPTGWRSMHGRDLQEKRLETPIGIWQFKKENDDMEIHGDISAEIQYISEEYPSDIDYDLKKLRVFSLDIEVLSDRGFPDPMLAERPITSIAIWHSLDEKMYVWGLEYEGAVYHNEPLEVASNVLISDQIVYKGFSSEFELLKHFISFWALEPPHIVTGWNLNGFDIPYMVNRIPKVVGEKILSRLSPWNIIKSYTKKANTRFGQEEQTVYTLVGISCLDYLEQYKKYTYSARESYTLDHIAYVELGERKLSYDEVSSLHELYQVDYDKFIRYNIKDAMLVKCIDDAMQLLALVTSVAYYAKINYDDVISPIRTWDSIVYNYLKHRHIAIPPNKKAVKTEKFAGAYVKEPAPGRYEWVVSVDLASLYPSLIRQINISPETLVDPCPVELYQYRGIPVERFVNREIELPLLKTYNLSLSANGQFFKRVQKGVFPVLLHRLYDERKADKKIMLEAKKAGDQPKAQIYGIRQQVKKILLNSAYGALGSPYFRYFDLRLAEAVTLSGQVAIQWIARKLNEYMNKLLATKGHDYVLAVDTDSNYLHFGPVVDRFFKGKSRDEIVDFLDKAFKDKIIPYITESYEEWFEYMNHVEQLMVMEREVIASTGIWSAKKQYMLRVHDVEGVRKDTMKVMGLTFIKSNTPEYARKTIHKLLDIILDGTNDQLITAIGEIREQWNKLPPETVAIPTSVGTLTRYHSPKNIFVKGTQAHIKAALIYNHILEKKNLDGIFPKIKEGDKIKYVYLKMPNPIFQPVIGFPHYLPNEFDLHEYVDYNVMFEKAFLAPMEIILNVISWETKKRASLWGAFQ